MNFQSVPETSVHIIGKNRLQNNLLAAFLEKETGLRCTSWEFLREAPVAEDGPGHTHLLLVDSQSGDAGSLWEGKPVVTETDHNRCLFALCNVEPGVEIERQALDQGLRGVFYNNVPLSILSRGVQAILKGELWYSRRTLFQCLQSPKPSKIRHEPPVDLTFREKEIINRIASGASNKDIARRLNISVNTVKTHLYHIYKKLNVTNRLQATIWASKYL